MGHGGMGRDGVGWMGWDNPDTLPEGNAFPSSGTHWDLPWSKDGVWGHPAAPQDALGSPVSPDLTSTITHGSAWAVSRTTPPRPTHGVPPNIQAMMGCTGSPGVQQTPVEMEVPPPTYRWASAPPPAWGRRCWSSPRWPRTRGRTPRGPHSPQHLGDKSR